MKSYLKGVKCAPEPIVFPYLAYTKGRYNKDDEMLVVLFSGTNSGTVVFAGKQAPQNLGDHLNNWRPCDGEHWKRFEYSIELSN